MLKPLLLLMLLSVAQSPDVDSQALEWFRRGEAMIGTPAEFTEEQAACFSRAVSISPGFREARYNLAVVLLAMQEYGRARDQASRLIADDPDSPRGYILRAEALSGLEEHRAVLDDLDEYLHRHPPDADSMKLKGLACFSLGNYEDSANAYLQAIELGRDNIGTRINAGLSLLNSRNLKGAEKVFTEITEVFPGSWQGHFWLGIGLKESGDLDLAAEALQSAEKIAPENESIRNELIDIFLALGNLEEAGARINRKSRKTAADYANLALLARARGNPEDALAYFRTAVQKDSNDASILARLGDTCMDLELEDEAVSAYRRVLELNPIDFSTLVNLAHLISGRGDLEESRDLLERAVSLDPGSADAQYRLATILDRLGDRVPAADAYRKSIALGGRRMVAHFRLGFLLAELGEEEEAMLHLEKAVSADPAKFMPYLHREARRIKSPLDSIRYTEEFSALLNKYRDYWVAPDDESGEPEAAPPLQVLEEGDGANPGSEPSGPQ